MLIIMLAQCTKMMAKCHLVGLPLALHANSVKVMVDGDVKRKCQEYGIEQGFTERHTSAYG